MTDPVLGATGTQGGAVTRKLLGASFPVRALVRDPASARPQALSDVGAQLIDGDLLDKASLARAFEGVEAVYAITTPFEHGADEGLRQRRARCRFF